MCYCYINDKAPDMDQMKQTSKLTENELLRRQ